MFLQEENVYDPSWRPELPDLDCPDKDPDNSLPMAYRYIEVSPVGLLDRL